MWLVFTISDNSDRDIKIKREREAEMREFAECGDILREYLCRTS